MSCIVMISLALALVDVSRSTNPATRRVCREDQFQCQNGHCIQLEWTCDSEQDCGFGDTSDEDLPSCPPKGTCSGKHQFECDNSDCISIEFRCDGDHDCTDGSDEKGCNDFTCTDGEWKCADGTHCVERQWVCDGQKDCVDGSDETTNCTALSDASTPPHH